MKNGMEYEQQNVKAQRDEVQFRRNILKSG